MKIDPFVRSRQANCSNRPPAGPPQTRPRRFNIETQPQFYAPGPHIEQEHEYEKYEQYFQQPYETPNESSFERYYKTIESQSNDEQDQEEECAELNFLD